MSGRKTTNILIDSNELDALRRQAAQAASLSQCNRALQLLSERNQQYLNQQQNRINALNKHDQWPQSDHRTAERSDQCGTPAAARPAAAGGAEHQPGLAADE